MATYAVDVSVIESSTLYVEAADEAEARRIAEEEGVHLDPDVRDVQVDEAMLLTDEQAERVSSYIIREDA